MTDVELRAATPADADAAAAYHDRCFRLTYSSQLLAGELTPPEPRIVRQQLSERFSPDSGYQTQVAVVGDEPIGHVTVCGQNLVHLFVDPDHQNTGLGRKLLGQGEAMIAASGHADAELHVRVDNQAAIAFYAKGGWTETGRSIHTLEDGIGYDEWVLVRHLATR